MGSNHCLACEKIPDDIPRTLIFIDPFGNDISGTGKGLFNIRNSIIQILKRTVLGISFILLKNQLCKWLKPLFTCDCGSCTSFGFKWKIDILKLIQIVTLLNLNF